MVWGRNHVSGPGEIHNANGYTAESTVNFLDKNYFYTRFELVDKDDLLRAADRLKLGITQTHPSFRIGAYTFGGARCVRKAIFVGSPLAGTSLAAPPRLRGALDLLTNVGHIVEGVSAIVSKAPGPLWTSAEFPVSGMLVIAPTTILAPSPPCSPARRPACAASGWS